MESPPHFNHFIYLHLLLMRVHESNHQHHSSTYLCNNCVNFIIFFFCVTAYLGLFHHHPDQKTYNLASFVLPFSRLPPVFLPSSPQMQAGASLSSLGPRWGGGGVLVLFEPLLDKSKGKKEAFLGVHQTSMQHLTRPKGNPFI